MCLDKPQCKQNRTEFIDVPRNVPLKLACHVDANPGRELIFHWSLFSPWTSTEIALDQFEHNDTIIETMFDATNQSISVLDVARTVELFQNNDNNFKPNLDNQLRQDHHLKQHLSDHSTLLLQCDAENVAGRQHTPCSFLLRIVEGKLTD